MEIDGGKSSVDVSDPKVIEEADFAINQLYGSRSYVLVSAQSQVVAGVNYFLTVQFPDSGEQCEITVYDRFGSKSIISNTCTGLEIDGGKSSVDVSDSGVIAASNFVIGNGGFPFPFTNYELVSAQSQIVAGIRYFLTYKFHDNGSTCVADVIYQSWIEPQYTPVSLDCKI